MLFTPSLHTLKIVLPSYKPWRDESDEDNVLFCSVHAHGDVTEAEGAKYSNGNVYTGMFYPGTGPIEKGVRGKGGILNVPLGPRFGSMEFRRAVERDVLPR